MTENQIKHYILKRCQRSIRKRNNIVEHQHMEADDRSQRTSKPRKNNTLNQLTFSTSNNNWNSTNGTDKTPTPARDNYWSWTNTDIEVALEAIFYFQYSVVVSRHTCYVSVTCAPFGNACYAGATCVPFRDPRYASATNVLFGNTCCASVRHAPLGTSVSLL